MTALEQKITPMVTVERANGGTYLAAGLDQSKPCRLEVRGEPVDFPARCNRVEIYWRRAGDFYAEIKGNGFFVAGVGATEAEAAMAAVRKIAA